MSRFGRPLALTFAFLAGGPALAPARAGACVDLCRIPCVKPISIADRWDDVTGIPGYMGDGGVRSPIWWNNQRWNHEEFEDANGNGLHDAGENFVDGNGNGAYDEELYDPATTGYRTPLDLGRELVLLPAGLATAPAPGQYFAVSLPPVNKGTPQTGNDPYRLHWSSCAETPVEPGDVLQTEALALIGPTNQEMQNRIALDPDAAWDEATGTVIGSAFPLSPRVLLLAAHDPRAPLVGHASHLVVRKVLAFFAERMVGSAQVQGRLLRVQAPGETCGGGSAGGFVVQCSVPATAASWGRLKATYR